MDLRIAKFIAKNHLLSLGVSDSAGVYAANCYYAWDEENYSLLIKSDVDSKHISLAMQNPNVGITITKDSKNLALLKGVQIKALFKPATKEQKCLYYAKFPFAKLASGEIFALEILWAKYTDNQLLLSQKLIYQKGEK